MNDLTVYILTHNRPEFVLEAIDSVLSQTFKDFDFVLSDSSDNDDTFLLLKEKDYLDKLIYKKRGNLSALDHFNLCIDEVSTRYFILFHDDDLMMPDMMKVLYQEIKTDKFVAVCCNGYFLYGKNKTSQKLFLLKNNVVLNPADIADLYCREQIAPFCGYLYDKNKLGSTRFINDCGKYSDVTWILNVSKMGSILWLNQPYMYDRVHEKQDSNIIILKDQLKLDCKLKTYLRKNNHLLNRRLHNIYSYESKKKHFRNIGLYLKYSPFYYFPRIIYKLIVNMI